MIKALRNNSIPHVNVRVPHWSILFSLAAIAILAFLTASVIAEPEAGNEMSQAVAVTFAINGVVGSVFLCKSIVEQPFSMVQMHWIFYLTMFVVAPFSQCYFGYSPWGYSLSTSDYLETNLALFVWAVLFALFSVGSLPKRESPEQNSFYRSLPEVDSRAVLRALAISIAAACLVVSLVGFANLFSRSDFSTDLDKTTGLLFDKAVRPLPVFAFILILARVKQQGKVSLALCITVLLMALACFPTGMARYNMACIYGAVLILICPTLFDKRGVFPVLFFLAFLVVFPAANAYRSETFALSMFGEAVAGALRNLPHGFCAVDYDAYSMVARTLSYVGDVGTTDGYQLLGALLFFVPRSVWPSKPEGSGNLVCVAQGQAQLNISSPLPAEGLVNFGIVGLIAFAILAALICRELDSWFAESSSSLRLFYPFACMLLFFMMRGDLLSSFAFSVGYAVSFGLLMIICLGPRACFAFEKTCGGYSQWLAFPASYLHQIRERLVYALDYALLTVSRPVASLLGTWSL